MKGLVNVSEMQGYLGVSAWGFQDDWWLRVDIEPYTMIIGRGVLFAVHLCRVLDVCGAKRSYTQGRLQYRPPCWALYLKFALPIFLGGHLIGKRALH